MWLFLILGAFFMWADSEAEEQDKDVFDVIDDWLEF